MLAFIARRLLALVPVLLIIASLIWGLLKLSPGDPARVLAGQTADPQVLAQVRAEWDLDKPLYVQYTRFLWRLLHFDLRESYVHNRPVSEIILERFPATMVLALASIALATLLGVLAGIIAALHQGKWLDNVVLTLSLIWISTPVFWLGLMFILLFASRESGLGWLPVSGYGDHGWIIFGVQLPEWRHLALPTLSLALLSTGYFARLTRSSMLEVIRQDYIRTAWAKGLSRPVVILRHALRNSLIPVVTVVGINFAYLLGGAVATEYVFAWPGLGKALLRAINLRDQPLVAGGVIFLTTIFVLVNLLVDLSYAVIDPRIRYE